MKITKLMLYLLFAGLMMAFTACSSDDDDESVGKVSEEDIYGRWYEKDGEYTYFYFFDRDHRGLYWGRPDAIKLEMFTWKLSGETIICKKEEETYKIEIETYGNQLLLSGYGLSYDGKGFTLRREGNLD